MKKTRIGILGMLGIGFIAGVIWVAACGSDGGSTIPNAGADDAADITFDKSVSGLLDATTVQAAIDELADERLFATANDTMAGTLTATGFSFSSAKTGYLHVPGIAFMPATHTNGSGNFDYASSNGARTGNGTAQLTLNTPVYLPNGAIVTGLTLNSDNTGLDISVSLNQYSSGGTNTAMASVSSSSTSATDDTITSATIDNSANSYYLSATILDDSMKIRTILITYTYTTPTF